MPLRWARSARPVVHPRRPRQRGSLRPRPDGRPDRRELPPDRSFPTHLDKNRSVRPRYVEPVTNRPAGRRLVTRTRGLTRVRCLPTRRQYNVELAGRRCPRDIRWTAAAASPDVGCIPRRRRSARRGLAGRPEQRAARLPAPQLTRSCWQNSTACGSSRRRRGEARRSGRPGRTHPVPYPVESALSASCDPSSACGIAARSRCRRVARPAVLLNFGPSTRHHGVRQRLPSRITSRYDAFSADVTGALRGRGPRRCRRRVRPTDAGGQPIGKQRNDPSGIFYTATSGIWQTVGWSRCRPRTSRRWT